MHSPKLRCILLSKAASYCASMHPSELRCTLWSTLHLTEPSWSYWVTQLTLHPLIQSAYYWVRLRPTELRCTLCFTLHPKLRTTELRCTLWSTLHPTEPSRALLSYAAAPSEQCCILLSQAVPFWTTLSPTGTFIKQTEKDACGQYDNPLLFDLVFMQIHNTWQFTQNVKNSRYTRSAWWANQSSVHILDDQWPPSRGSNDGKAI